MGKIDFERIERVMEKRREQHRMTVAQLRAELKKRGVKRYSHMKKSELRYLLSGVRRDELSF